MCASPLTDGVEKESEGMADKPQKVAAEACLGPKQTSSLSGTFSSLALPRKTTKPGIN